MRARTGFTDFGGGQADACGSWAELSDLVDPGEGFDTDRRPTRVWNGERFRNRATRRRNRHRHELLGWAAMGVK